MKVKLIRDKVVSIVNGKELVGVYYIEAGKEKLMGEFSPRVADTIIKLWNGKESK